MIKIAIYSRKSVFTGKGESIENQIELCKNYCNTYVNSGSNLEYIIYEDEGFSGKNTNRPEFQHMIDDIKKIKLILLYAIDLTVSQEMLLTSHLPLNFFKNIM